MTRNEMLDAINMKIARTGGGTGPGETGYYYPIMIGDVLDWYETEIIKVECEYKFSSYFEDHILSKWKKKREPLDKQSDDCIQYVYNLIK